LFVLFPPANLAIMRGCDLLILLILPLLSASTTAHADDSAAAKTAAAAVPQDIVIETTDRRGDPLRDAAREFLTKLADGDAAGARALFAGPKDQAEFLDAALAGVEASQKLRKSFQARFPGSQEIEGVGVDSEIRRLARLIDVETFIRKGDTASMSPGSTPFLEGLDYKLADGRWKITHLTVFAKHTPSHIKFTKAVTAALTSAARKLDAGEFKTAQDVAAALRADLDPAYQEEKSTDRAPVDATTQSAPRSK
jgi:hypothetical protein